MRCRIWGVVDDVGDGEIWVITSCGRIGVVSDVGVVGNVGVVSNVGDVGDVCDGEVVGEYFDKRSIIFTLPNCLFLFHKKAL